MNQYEYKVILLNEKELNHFEDDLTDRLNHSGKDGWELVSSVSRPCLGGSQYALIGITQKLTLIFKRRMER